MNHVRALILSLLTTFTLAVSLACASRSSRAQSEGHPQRALLIAINDYAHVGDLNGCINDVELIRKTLIALGLPEDGVEMLTDKSATRDGILAALGKLADEATKEQTIYVHYSGHGSQMRDDASDGDEEDHLDETIVPQDSRDPEGRVRDISDDELHTLLARIAGRCRSLAVVLDSCHSGTGTRGAVRAVEADLRPRLAAVRELTADPNDPRRREYVLLAACRSTQVAQELRAPNGATHGILSYYWSLALRNASGASSYRDLYDRLRPQVQDADGQDPQLEGQDADTSVFGIAELVPERPFVLAQPRPTADEIDLDVGEIHGVAAGTRYSVYSPGTKHFSSTKPLGEAIVVESGPFVSRARLTPAIALPPSCRALELERVFALRRLPVEVRGQGGEAEAVRTQVKRMPFAKLVDRVGEDGLILEHSGDRIVLKGPGARRCRSEISGPEQLSDQVESRVAVWARWHNILGIGSANTTGDIAIGLPVDSTAEVTAGEVLACNISNRGKTPLYLSVLVLAGDGSITVAYPPANEGAQPVAGGATIPLRFRTSLALDADDGQTDHVLVVSSARPADLTVLAQVAPGAREGEALSGPLGELLRGTGKFSARNLALDAPSWGVTRARVEVRRASR